MERRHDVVDLTDDSDLSASSYAASPLNPAKRTRIDPSNLTPVALLNPRAYLASNSPGASSSSRNGQHQQVQRSQSGRRTPDTATAPVSLNRRMESLHGLKDRKVRAPKAKDGAREAAAEAPQHDRRQGQSLLSKHASNRSSTPDIIDLTYDDSNDVVVNEEETNRELCFGALRTKVLAHREPEVPPDIPIAFESHWPRIPCTISRRRLSKDHIIRVLVKDSPSSFGMLANESAAAIAALYDGLVGGPIRFGCAILPQPRRPENSLGHLILEFEAVLYGRPSLFQKVGDMLSSKNIYLQQPLEYDKSSRYQNPHYHIKLQRLKTGVLQPPRYQDISRTVEEIQRDIDSMFDNIMASEAKLPEKEAPDVIVTPLYKHQKQALYWLERREAEPTYEDTPDNPCLWRTRQKGGQTVYYNLITNQETKTKPDESRGGILADDMGLGKTISCLAHMCYTLPDAIAFAQENSINQKLSKDGNPIDIVTPIKCAKTTLIIAPLSTVSNWEEQLATHIKPDTLTTYIYHGTNREGSIDRLAEYDCIVTTYSTLSQDFMRLKKNLDDVDNMARLAASPLHHLNFFRIILDEAHVIKDTSTNQSIAACALSAQRRLCLTGTPLQNRLDDYAALVKFLRITPFENKHVWTNYIGGPLKGGNQTGLSRLQILTSATTLRRSKTQKIDDKPILDLPAKLETTRYIYMSAEERQVYELTRKASKNMVENITTARQMKEYINILQAIMRLRQICCHRALLAGGGEPPQSETVINGGTSQSDAINVDELDLQVKKPLSPQQAYQLFELMKEAGQTMCVGCRRRDIAVLQSTGEKDPASTKQVLGYLTPCAEPLCHTCVQMYKDYIPGYHDGIVATCPVCGALAEMKMFELKERDAVEVKRAGRRKFALDGSDGIEPSSKLMVLMNDLDTLQERSKEADKPLKSVVFSQWTSMLDLVEIELRKRNVGYCRLDGSMKRVDRTSAIMSFQSDPETVVMLVSIKAGGVGLNLTAASYVFVFEPAWNPAIEQQAVDRVHRLGQTSDVNVIRYIAKDSIEENMVQLQQKKKELADLVNQKRTKEELSSDRLRDLRMLFG